MISIANKDLNTPPITPIKQPLSVGGEELKVDSREEMIYGKDKEEEREVFMNEQNSFGNTAVEGLGLSSVSRPLDRVRPSQPSQQQFIPTTTTSSSNRPSPRIPYNSSRLTSPPLASSSTFTINANRLNQSQSPNFLSTSSTKGSRSNASKISGGTGPSQFLLTVVPPMHLPHDPPHPRTSSSCSGYGPQEHFRYVLTPFFPWKRS